MMCPACLASGEMLPLWRDRDNCQWFACACGSHISEAGYDAGGYGSKYVAQLLSDEGGSLDVAFRNHTHNADLFAQVGTTGNRFLDVGTGHGASQRVMQARGWQASGWDVSAEGRPAGTMVSKEFRATLWDHAFHAVLCREVLEHTDSPHDLLRELYFATAIGGVCQITTPRPQADGQEWTCYQRAHLCLWEPKILERTLERIGFSVVGKIIWKYGQRFLGRRS